MYVCGAIFFVLTCLLILTAKEIGDGVVARTLCGTSEYMVRPMVWYLRFLFIHITVLIRLLRCWHAPATTRVWTGGPWELSFLRWCQVGRLFRPARRRTWPQVHCANLPAGQHPLTDEGTAWEGHVCAAVTITLSISNLPILMCLSLRNKRLGAAKSAMFSVGTHSILKLSDLTWLELFISLR